VQLPGGELGEDAGATDGDVPGVEGAAPRRPPESPPVAAAVATDRERRTTHTGRERARLDGSQIESQQVNVVGVKWTFRMPGPTCQGVITVDF
jgi:hypothetical protein